ncbi:MAG: hypothetical protein V3R60_04615 [Acidobacteriota bacterium]
MPIFLTSRFKPMHGLSSDGTHALQAIRGISESAIRSLFTTLQGNMPPCIGIREVLERPGFRAKREANRRRWETS